MTTRNFNTFDTYDTELFADSVEWCPVEPFTDIFVCGTYQLSSGEGENEPGRETEPKKRIGRIYLFRVINTGKLSLLQRLDVPGVLDIKWMHVKMDQKILLGVANSAGYVQVYELANAQSALLVLLKEKKINEGNSDVLALSLDWSSGKCMTDERDVKIVVSDSKGCISILKFHEENLEQERAWNAHDYEAWIAAFDYWNTNVVYTGGDDCKLKWFDIRMDAQPAGINRIHGAGVTSLHSNAAQEYLLASGSYDEILRLWDIRKIRNPLSEINLTGGIWRLKWDPKAYKYLIAACMYGGFKIISCADNGAPNIFGEYMEHESISYGCDWSHMDRNEIEKRKIIDQFLDTEALIATCSFYDHTLKLSTVNLNKPSE